MNRQFNVKKVLETFITAAVVLSVIHILIVEYSRYAHWSIRSRNVLLVAGFCFDLLFSVEFTVRSVLNGRRGNFLSYIKNERGWADFLSSFPIFFLESAPSVFLIIFSGAQGDGEAVIAVTVFKAVRITRLIRLFRIVRFPWKNDYTGSKMALDHISVITTTAVLAIVSVVIISDSFSGRSAADFSKDRSDTYLKLSERLKKISDNGSSGFKETSVYLFQEDRNILKVQYSDGRVVESINDNEFKEYYSKDDYISVTGNGCTLLISIADFHKDRASGNIKILMIMIVCMFSFMFFYTWYFVRNISDVAHIMNLGFRKKDYNLLVKIPEGKSDHEIFRVAKFYNEAYLPSKIKRMESSGDKRSSLSMKDLMDFR